MVSIKLNNCKNEQSNNNLTSVNRNSQKNLHAKADSMFNQSANGKSKAALVTLPLGNSVADPRPAGRKVTISFKDSAKIMETKNPSP